MSNVGGVGISVDVACEFEFGDVSVTRAHVSGLQSLELLLRAKLVGLTDRKREYDLEGNSLLGSDLLR